MNSELFSWGTRVPVSMFGLEFFLVLGALLFFFTCYQVIKIGLKILEEIQDKLSEVKWGERVGAKRKYGTQNKYTGLSSGSRPLERPVYLFCVPYFLFVPTLSPRFTSDSLS